MEEIKIRAIQDESKAVALSIQPEVDTERLLEDILVKNPDMLVPSLKLVGRQTPTEGGLLDLLGVDEDGRLVVFELKRGALSRDAVAQIIDYASYLAVMDVDEMARYIERNSGQHEIENVNDFQEWYNEQGFGELDALLPPRMVLVGLGADQTTERMVAFLANNGNFDIELLTFHGFAYDGKTFFAKQVEVSRPATRALGDKLSSEQKWVALRQLAKESNVSELFQEVEQLFKNIWPQSLLKPGKVGFSVTLVSSPGNQRRSYVRVDPENGKVWLIFYRRAFELCSNRFGRAVERLPYETWPRNVDPLDGKNSEIHFCFTPQQWESRKDELTSLISDVYKAWQDHHSDDDTETE